jgi:hypothetical protein
MTIDSVINNTAEEQQQQQTSGDSSLIKTSIQDDVEEKQTFDIIDGEAVGANEIRVANAVITGWRLNLVLVW